MNPAGKKFISLFLVFSLFEISCTTLILPKKERRFPGEKNGATLTIHKKNNRQIRGELLLVRKNWLLLLNTEGKDMPINIEDIEKIVIGKKSEFAEGALAGMAIGALIGVVYGNERYSQLEYDMPKPEYIMIYSTIFTGIGFLIGAIIGAAAGTDETIQIEGMTDSEIQETLDYLSMKARIHDYEYYPKTDQKTEEKVEKVEALEFKIKVKVEEAIIRLRPQEESEVIAKVPLGKIFAPERKVGEWYQVSFRDERGFILLGFIHESEVDVLEEIIRNLKNTRNSGQIMQESSYS